MRQLLYILTPLVLLISSATADINILIEPAPFTHEATHSDAIVLNYLHERLDEHASTPVVSPVWARAILARLDPMSIRLDDGLLQHIRKELPVDALIRIEGDQLQLETGEQTHRWPVPEEVTRQAAIQLSTQLSQALGQSIPELLEERYSNDRHFQLHYGLPSFYQRYPNSTGAAALTELSSTFMADRANVDLARLVITAGLDVLGGRRGTPQDKQSAKILTALALPGILGTHHEAMGIRLVGLDPDVYRSDLLKLLKRPAADDLESVLADDNAPPALSAAQRASAWRLLNAIDPEAAAPLKGKSDASAPATQPQTYSVGLDSLHHQGVIEALKSSQDVARARHFAFSSHTGVSQAARNVLRAAGESPLYAGHLNEQLAAAEALPPDDVLDHPSPFVVANGLSRSSNKTHLQDALDSDYLYIRLHAAWRLRELKVTISQAEALLEKEKDPVMRLLLQQLGDLPFTAPPPAKSIDDANPRLWLCGMGESAPTSPFTGYYLFRFPDSPEAEAASAAGKAIVVRVSPIGNPGLLITDEGYRRTTWLRLIKEVPVEALSLTDGLVFGEESMNLDDAALWDTGGELFCREQGINAESLDQLTGEQRRAWRYWARERCIDGFNELARFTRAYFGTLRPGIKVVSFLPTEALHANGSHAGDQRLDFDIGGLYDYKGCNRLAAYFLTRRHKTLWPDRPVIWLSLGIGGYEMNPVRYDHKAPTAPILSRGHRSYADTVSAWLGGAQAGWFSVWMFVDRTFAGGRPTSGKQVGVENVPTANLDQAIKYAFRGVLEERIKMQDITDAGTPEVTIEDDAGLDFALDEKPDPAIRLQASIDEEKVLLKQGMLLNYDYVMRCVRLFGDVPAARPAVDPVLLIRDNISVWTRDGANPMAPAFELFTSCDFICNVDAAPRLDLSRYTIIAIAGRPRMDENTVAALTDWLNKTQGILILQAVPNKDAEPWPWKPGRQGEQGIVHIDTTPAKSATAETLDAMAAEVNGYLEQLGASYRIPASHAIQQGTYDGTTYTATSRYYQKARVPAASAGIDLLTGEANPQVGRSSSGAITTTDWTSSHHVVRGELSVSSTAPITDLNVTDDAMTFKSTGLVRIRPGTQVAGEPINEATPGAFAVTPELTGQVTHTVGDTTVTYVRSAKTISISRR